MQSRKTKTLFSLVVLVSLLLSLVIPSAGAQAGPTPPTVEVQAEKAAVVEVQPLDAGINLVRDFYSFSSTTGTYTEITGGTLHGSGTSVDDTSYNGVNIGFTFRFNGMDYTQLGINANGFIRLGGTAFTGTCGYTAISSTDTVNCANLAAAQSEDLQGDTTAELRSELLGTAPNQVFVIQWKNFKHYGSGGTGDNYNFQIRLYETSNLVEFVYGTYIKNATARTPQVGIKGANNTDYENRTTTTDWANSTRGTANNNTMALNTTVYPPSGLTYTWAPPPPAANLTTSTKTAPVESLVGAPIHYDIAITNTGDLATTETTLADPIPAGTTYVPDSVTCDGGSCGYDDVLNQITWYGPLDIGQTVTVGFDVDPTGLPCGGTVTNTATIEDAIAIPASVVRSASTRLVAVIPVPIPLTSFDDATFPPDGWAQTQLVGTGLWNRVTSGTSPVILPHSGAGMARWNSFSYSTGTSARLETPTLTLPVDEPYTLAFYMSHDTGYASAGDRIEMQISTDDGATWTDMGIVFYRYDAAYTTPGWGMHTVNLAAYAGQTQVKVGFNAISGYGNNFYVDDVALLDAGYPCPCAVTSSTGGGCQADSADHTITVTCGVPATVDLALSGGLWNAVVEPAVVDVPAGGSATAIVSVDVPFGADLFDSDSLTVTATPQEYPDAFAISTVSTSFNGFAGNWTAMAPLPEGRVFHAEAVTEDYVFVIGGTSDAGGATPVDTNYRYTIATDTWETMAPLPITASEIGAAVLDGKIYIPGASTTIWDDNTYVYDIAADTWSTIPTSGGFIGGSQYAVVADPDAGILYRLGGLVDDGAGGSVSTNRAFALDTATQTWTEIAPMTESRISFGAAFINGNIYAAGGVGFPGFTPVNTTEIFDGTAWSYGAPVPTDATLTRWSYNAYGSAWDSLMLMGGRRDTSWGVLNHTGMYLTADDAWVTSPTLPTLTLGRVYLAGGSNTSSLWATGGRNSGGSILYDTHEYLPVCVEAVAGVVVTPETDEQFGLAGTDVTYTLTLENTGNMPDEYWVDIDSIWMTNYSPLDPIALGPGETVEITVIVSVPPSALSGNFDVATVTFYSMNDGAVSDASTLTTTAVVPPVFTKEAPAEAIIGDVITYTITLDPYYMFASAITDVLPDGVEYVDGSLVVTPDVGTYGYDDGTRTVSWEYQPALGLNGWKPVVVTGKSLAGVTPATHGVQAVPAPVTPAANPKAVLWDQPLSTVNQNAYVNQDFTDAPDYSSFLADDFEVTGNWTVDTIFIPGNGWSGFTSLMNADSLTWMIYANQSGIPAGDPTGGGDAPLWAITLDPTDPQVTITNGSGGLPSDTTLVLDTPIDLSTGHYWLVFYPSMPFSTGGQYGRQPSDTVNEYVGQFINPGGGFGLGTNWQDWTVLVHTMTDIAFRLEGTSGPTDVTITFDVTVTAEPDTLITNVASLVYAEFPFEAQAQTLVLPLPIKYIWMPVIMR